MPSYQQFKLPDVGEGLTEADIAEWHVSVGDTVAVNQNIVEIETAKSLVELPAPWAGVVTEILVAEGETVPVGTPIVVIDVDPGGQSTDDDGATQAASSTSGDVLVGYGTKEAPVARRRRRTPAAPAPQAGPVGAAVPGATAVGQAASSAPAGPAGTASPGETTSTARLQGGMPRTSAATTTPREPAPSAAGQSDTPAAGSATTQGAAPGAGSAASQGGTPPPPASPAQVPAERPAVGAPAAAAPSAQPPAAVAAGREPAAAQSPAVLAKPPVRKLAKDLGVDLSVVAATGPGGIITREDVVAHAQRSEAEQLATYPGDDKPWLADGVVAADGRRTRVPVRSVRRRTAEAMVNSAFTAPHVTVFHTVDVTRSMKLVARLKEDRAFADVRVTPLLLAAKALVLAVRRHPQVNAAWDDDAQEIVYKHYVNLGIAAATPRGLMVPNIKDAHRMDLHELATEIAELTATARTGRIAPQAMADGTITITNVGVFGIDTGTPILNPGESAILAFGAIRKQPWVHRDRIKPRWVTQLALSFDHRLVDGELGSRVLADVARVLENPDMGLVWS